MCVFIRMAVHLCLCVFECVCVCVYVHEVWFFNLGLTLCVVALKKIAKIYVVKKFQHFIVSE